jgi:CheY-like chemotaxis protein
MLTVDVIEEDLAMRALLCEWLDGEGYRVTARAGIGTVARTEVHAVVVDLLDLQGQGAEIIRRAKSLYTDSALIGLSTQVGESDAGRSRQARALGLARLVSKPCSRRELVTAVAGAIGGAS